MIGPRDIGARLPTRFGNRIDPYGFNGYREPRGYLGGAAPPVAGYSLWLDAADKSTLVTESDGHIIAWLDKSGARNHLAGFNTLASASDQLPRITSARSINGITCPEFIGPSGQAGLLSRIGENLLNFEVCTWFHVAVIDNFTVGRMIVCGDVNSTFEIQYAVTTGIISVNSRNVAALESTTGSPTAGVAHQVTVKLNTTQSPSALIRLDGAEDLTNGSSFTFTNTAHGISLGMRGTNNQWDGLIGEIIYYPGTALSSGDIDLVESYLAAKWGTP